MRTELDHRRLVVDRKSFSDGRLERLDVVAQHRQADAVERAYRDGRGVLRVDFFFQPFSQLIGRAVRERQGEHRRRARAALDEVSDASRQDPRLPGTGAGDDPNGFRRGLYRCSLLLI